MAEKNLAEFAPFVVVEQGFERMSLLEDKSDEELKKLAKDAGMKEGHQLSFIRLAKGRFMKEGRYEGNGTVSAGASGSGIVSTPARAVCYRMTVEWNAYCDIKKDEITLVIKWNKAKCEFHGTYAFEEEDENIRSSGSSSLLVAGDSSFVANGFDSTKYPVFVDVSDIQYSNGSRVSGTFQARGNVPVVGIPYESVESEFHLNYQGPP